jgi:hypothetical protein
LAAEAALVALLVAGTVSVQSETSCPSAAAVETRLPALTSPADGPPDRALIRHLGGMLTLTLVRADGSTVVERQLGALGSCEDLAGAAALVIAVWQAQEHAAIPLASRIEPPRPPAARPLALEARSDVFASFAGAQVGPGATLSVSLWRQRWGLALSLSGTTPREQALGRGRAAWSRPAIGFGPVRRLWAGWARVDLQVQALAGMTIASGTGYRQDAAPTGWTPGGAAGLYVSHLWRKLVVSVGAMGALWGSQELLVSVSGDRQGLPRTELRAGAGLGFQFDP